MLVVKFLSAEVYGTNFSPRVNEDPPRPIGCKDYEYKVRGEKKNELNLWFCRNDRKRETGLLGICIHKQIPITIKSFKIPKMKIVSL